MKCHSLNFIELIKRNLEFNHGLIGVQILHVSQLLNKIVFTVVVTYHLILVKASLLEAHRKLWVLHHWFALLRLGTKQLHLFDFLALFLVFHELHLDFAISLCRCYKLIATSLPRLDFNADFRGSICGVISLRRILLLYQDFDWEQMGYFTALIKLKFDRTFILC